jgi:CRISPR-associated protein Cmr6
MVGLLPAVHGEAIIAAVIGRDQMLPRMPRDASRVQGNPGLVFDRFLKIWEHNGSERVLLREDRQRALAAFCDAYAALADTGRGLLGALHRRFEMLDTSDARSAVGWACRSATFTTRWRVVTGVGSEHPLENGFTFDRSIGAPYFPGSGVKGMCRAAARDLLDADAGELSRLFGGQPEDTGDENDAAAGDLVFFPAYPARDHWPCLKVDIINHHHASYAAALDRGDPSPQAVETDSPIPVFFLTVAAETPFTFRIGSRSGSAEAVERGFQILESGLDLLGLGAKTAAGYGQFSPARPTPR